MKECEICGSTHRVCNTPIGLLCNRHYMQYWRFGKILSRTTKDPNEIIKNKDGSALIILYNNRREPIAKTIVDQCDLPLITKFKWRLGAYGYAVTRNDELGLANYRLHRMLLGDPKGYDVDHINGDRLDNRRENLRLATRQQNSMNKRMGSGISSSGHTGVYPSGSLKKPWKARIMKDGVYHHLGLFKTKDEAVHARMKAEIQMFGEFSSNYNNNEQSNK